MAGFDLSELGLEAAEALWLRGGFPRSFLANNEADSLIWRRDFIRTLLEGDLPQLGKRVPAVTLQRFWAMLAHGHGQPWNGAELGRSLGINPTTCRRYLDLLAGVFMVRLLQPWHANLQKRQVKAPKIYFRDSGLLHQLLQISDRDALLCHPRLGASWEGFVIEQLLAGPATRGSLVLGHPRRRRTGSAANPRRTAHRRGDQAGRCPQAELLHAPSASGSGARSPAGDHPIRARLSAE